MPELKQESDLTPADFLRLPVWIGVHNFDSDEPWYENSDEETFRPWTGPLPFKESRGFVLVAATFTLRDGSVYPGYFRSVRDDESRRGNKTEVLVLQSPIIFIDGRSFDFRRRVPGLQRAAARQLYSAFGKKAKDVFPVRFAASPALARGVVTGNIEGFYGSPTSTTTAALDGGSPASLNPIGDYRLELAAEDFQINPVWAIVPFHDASRAVFAQRVAIPWTGPLPVEAGADVRISATFTLRDGRQYPGSLRPAPENWADAMPPPVKIGNVVLQSKPPRVRYGDSAQAGAAIFETQMPCLYVDGRRFQFWCGSRDCEETRVAFYAALGETGDELFPIHFAAAEGLARGVVAGELNGFYKKVWKDGQPPRCVR